MEKLKVLVELVTDEQIDTVLVELKEYIIIIIIMYK